MNKSEKNWLTIIAIVVGVVILWILFHKNTALQQVIAKNVPWLDPVISASSPAPDYNMNIGGYVPAEMPSQSSNKCDGNSPCVLCTIPNATYPSTPVKVSTTAPSYKAVNISAPKTFNQSMPDTGYVWGRWI